MSRGSNMYQVCTCKCRSSRGKFNQKSTATEGGDLSDPLYPIPPRTGQSVILPTTTRACLPRGVPPLPPPQGVPPTPSPSPGRVDLKKACYHQHHQHCWTVLAQHRGQSERASDMFKKNKCAYTMTPLYSIAYLHKHSPR